VVGEVVAGEGVDSVGVAGDMGEGDRDNLALARCGRERGGAVEQVARNGREECGGDHGGHVDTGVGALDDVGDVGGVNHRRLVDHVLGLGGHGRSIGGVPDTGLTRGWVAYAAVVIAVSVLGLVELNRDGERVSVRAGKTTEVLIRLALEAGVMVRTDRLIEDLWADEAVGTARNTLQTKVSRLRRPWATPRW
jgi:hypothetical protein